MSDFQEKRDAQPIPTAAALIGCAGWSIPKSFAQEFPELGSHLERYAARLRGVEINSSFYRPHRVQTYTKWAASVPEEFRFAVKVPKSITHENRLKDTGGLLDSFLAEVAGLGEKLGPLLVQLPPSLRFEDAVAEKFFSELRSRFAGQVVCEPRHFEWFGAQATEMLTKFQVARVAADPALSPQAAIPGGWLGIAYYRLHGSPTIYRSAYTSEFVRQLRENLQAKASEGVPTWCIFDNTAEGAATGNALELADSF